MGPKNTNTPNPTPTTKTPSGGAPRATSMPPLPPMPPSPQPNTPNTTSRRNSIPSSAKGDIILHTDKPASTSAGPKKGIIIAMIFVGLALILGFIIFALTSNNSSNVSNTGSSSSNNTTDTTTASLDEIIDSFYNLSNFLIGGNSNVPKFDAPLSNWQISRVANSISVSVDQQAEYSDNLSELLETFSNYIQEYTTQNPDQDAGYTTLSNRLSAARVYLRGEFFLNNLNITLQDSPEEAQSFVDGEIGLAGELSDEIAFSLVSYIKFYYDEYIKPERNDDLMYSFAAGANDTFNELLNTLPDLLSSINSSLKESNE